MAIVDQWQKSFAQIVESLAPSGSDEVSRFWVLFVTGKSFGPGSWFWHQSFRHLYILHLLVLSGSQVEALSKLVRLIFNQAAMWLGAGGLVATRAAWLRPCLTAVLLGFAAATEWSAPITRATLIAVAGLWTVRWNPLFLMALAFVFQWLVFSEHQEQIGFYLSWIAYLVVVLMANLRVGRLASTAMVSTVLFLVVDTGYFDNPFSWRALTICVAANLLFCGIFDLAFMPLAAVFIAMALVLATLGLAFGPKFLGTGDFLALWTEPMVEALLVVLKWLMYT